MVLASYYRDKCGLPLKKEIKQIKEETFVRSIADVKPAANESGDKRSSSPAYEPSVEKKLKTSSAARGGSSVTKKLVIDLTFFQWEEKDR